MTPSIPPRVVLYDGQCGLCDKSVQWVLRHDPKGAIHFATLDSGIGQEIRSRHPEIPAGLDSILFVTQDSRSSGGSNERVFWRSRAAFEVLRFLPQPWRMFSVLRWFPAVFMDIGYRFVARIRYAVWGYANTCRVPTPGERQRFLQ